MAWEQGPCLGGWRGGRLEPEARYGWGEAKGDLWPPLTATARRGDLLEA